MNAPPPLRLFIDRSINSRRFVTGLRRLVDDVETIDDRYGVHDAEDVKDERWIADATIAGRILVGADKRILSTPSERRAVCRARARYIVYGSNNISIARRIELFEHNLPAIQLLTPVPGPWVARIAQHGMHHLTLNCADA